jgi:hypothetical protein
MSPPGTGTVDVTVTTPAGTSATSPVDDFAYRAVPGAPTNVSASAGFTCSLLVTLMAPASSGSSPILSYTVTAVGGGYSFPGPGVPTLGLVSMDLTGVPDGTYSFTAHATNAAGDGPESAPSGSVLESGCGDPSAPTVTSVSPSSGSVSGGTVVTVTGTGFTGATNVAFGGVFGTAVQETSDTSMTATSPAGTGTVDILVPGVSGVSATSSADEFTYLPDSHVPGAPTSVSATINCSVATVTFVPPAVVGDGPVLVYTATGSGGYTGTGSTSPITVNGLPPNQTLTFTVFATNVTGSGPFSVASNAVHSVAC